jgi:hypothetical protein
MKAAFESLQLVGQDFSILLKQNKGKCKGNLSLKMLYLCK